MIRTRSLGRLDRFINIPDDSEGPVRGSTQQRVFEIKNAWAGDIKTIQASPGSSFVDSDFWDGFTDGWNDVFDGIKEVASDLLEKAVKLCAIFRKASKLISAGEQILEGDYYNAAMNLAEAGAEIAGVDLPVDLPNQPSASVAIAEKVCSALEVVRTIELIAQGAPSYELPAGAILPEARIAPAGEVTSKISTPLFMEVEELQKQILVVQRRVQQLEADRAQRKIVIVASGAAAGLLLAVL